MYNWGMEPEHLIVKFDIFTPINALELKTRRRFTYAEIARETGLSRQTVWKLLKRESQDRVDVTTLSGFIAWFRRNGIDATADTFFQVVPN